LQALAPLQLLMPAQWTAADLADAGVKVTPFMASAMAAMARLAPEATLLVMLNCSTKKLAARAACGLHGPHADIR